MTMEWSYADTPSPEFSLARCPPSCWWCSSKGAQIAVCTSTAVACQTTLSSNTELNELCRQGVRPVAGHEIRLVPSGPAFFIEIDWLVGVEGLKTR